MLAKKEYLAILTDFKKETENLNLIWEKTNQTSFKLKNRNNDINIIFRSTRMLDQNPAKPTLSSM